MDGRTAFLAKERGDEAGTQVVEDYIEHLTCGLTNLVNIFFPEVLAPLGRRCQSGRVLLAPRVKGARAFVRRALCRLPTRASSCVRSAIVRA